MEPTESAAPATISHSASSMALTTESRQEQFRKRLESEHCLLCNAKAPGVLSFQHYISCTKIFLKELQDSFVPSSILSYCLDESLLENIYSSPQQLQQLQTLIAHLQHLQASIIAKSQPAPAKESAPAAAAPAKGKKK
ncbi:hypothetical protein DFA_02572 [Cavenderia fasciculata]|uniref:Uncharacterized protein n=1 Tax=Cavenderia fasciculata TaxID=261658 RepID=F4PZR9_CACFS|nr:uncharacterized protein DFA_02572 [Cavenderia fasciculata]EGG18833.1 hypothetical protein DFA_02572 [Cavenderia fasciculata]|eukprot:XP_004357295.1 hypothetical protein DFA_02572 [Cavenderia fasciculata]